MVGDGVPEGECGTREGPVSLGPKLGPGGWSAVVSIDLRQRVELWWRRRSERKGGTRLYIDGELYSEMNPKFNWEPGEFVKDRGDVISATLAV